ncbi:patatin-like phospholipase family protein [Caballeronia insecticola]|uniref:Putative patatin-like phospholipase n=1 Tax=Caballeronia insecticola TaxID=758793 RepID=R4WKH9_9BURK|nr:patatin-like phospholipase family protein [Caballeronia insecticola]BAN24959.1 putative patatin-like phospholipase [Caballeronia insecticola]
MAAIPKVAIACQGGGSHAAFAAGVLEALLSGEFYSRFELVALSGTSGGAMCSALAWAGLLLGGPADAIRRLSGFWTDLQARDGPDIVANALGTWYARLPVNAEISPYLYPPVAEERLRELLDKHLPFASLPAAPEQRAKPTLLIGATDVQSGDRVIFTGEKLDIDQLVASAAVPPLYRAVAADGRLCWDGLFSSNPPVREFTDFALASRPDEIWVVQINPQYRRELPESMNEIIDRRNELSGNLALGQELYFTTRVNELLTTNKSLAKRYKPIKIRVVQMHLDAKDYPGPLDYASKLDRNPALIHALIRKGRERAAWFFDERSNWPRDDTVPHRSVYATRPPMASNRS